MKIQKFNETNKYNQEELDNFIKLFKDKFFTEKYIQSYSCIPQTINNRITYINIILKFANITKKELPVIQEIMEFIEPYDKDYVIWMAPKFSISIECTIGINKVAFNQIYDQLKIENTSNKYNL